MSIIARCNGTALVEDGDRLGVVEQGGGWLPVAIFVAALLALIPLGAGIAMLSVSLPAGAALVAGSSVGIVAVVALLRLRRRRRAEPPPAPWLVFDRGAGALLDGNGATVAPLERITLEQVWQAGSSSKALAVRHPDGRVVIARGNPFGDSIDAVEHALRQRLGTR